MKGTLKKVSENEYSLFTDNKLNGLLTHKLSIKNCQAIENGYDLDELARNYVDEQPNDFLYTTDEYWNAQVDFQKGFQKAMELMEGKKYSEEDMVKAIITTQVSRAINNKLDRLELIQSLQQTEWEVEISRELVGECEGNNDNGCFMDSCGHNCGCFSLQLKLDKDGCLILKRI